MIDVNKITSTLAKLPDQQLQQYAQLHKNDPYIMALAMSESNRRKAVRSAGQGAQGMQEQPKVVDQMVAEMAPQQLPEEMGIGQLPAGNMDFAGGGIVAFADGGDVERYNGAQGSAVSLNAIESKYQQELQEMGMGTRMRYSPDVQEYVKARAQTSPDSTPVQVNPIPNAPPQAPARPPLGSSLSIEQILKKAPSQRTPEDNASLESAGYKLQRRVIPQDSAVNVANTALTNFGPSLRSTLTAGASQLTDEELAKKPAVGGALSERILRGLGISPTPLQMESAAGQNMTAQAPTAAQQRDALSENQAAAAVDASRLRDKRKDTGRKDTERKETGRKDERKDPSAKTDTGELDSIINSYTRALDLGIGENRNARVGLAAALEQTPKTRAERNAEERAKDGDVFAGREARLAERERGIEGMGDKYLGLALLQAGAAMMSTPGNIGAALGKGIAVGSERYIAGIDKINAAKDKFAEARDRLEDLRLNRADMTKKEVREDQRAIDDGILQAKKLLADGATNDLKISADAQTKIFGAVADNFQTNKRLTSAEGIARLQASTANRPGAEMQAVERIMKEKNIPFTEALALYNSNRREPQTAEMLLKAWTGNVLLQQQYPNPQDYVKMMAGSAGGASQLSPADKALVEKYSR